MKRRGMTFLSILLVIAIFSLLVTLALENYRKTKLKRRVAEVKTIVGVIYDAEEAYASENGVYLSSEWTPPYNKIGCRQWQNTRHFEALGIKIHECVYHIYGVAPGDWRTRDDLISIKPPSDDTILSTEGVDISIIAAGDLDGDGHWSFYVRVDGDTTLVHRYDDF